MKDTLLLLCATICMALSTNSHAQVYVEDFESGYPNGWFDLTEAGFDFVSWFGGEVSMFKQSEGDEILMFGTDLQDLSLYTKWDVDLYAFNLSFNSDTKPLIQMGIMTDPSDMSTFVPLKSQTINNTTASTYSVFLGAYDGMAHLTLKMIGERSQITYIDNWKMYDDVFDASFPLAVDDISLTPAPNGGLSMTVDWTNPTKEADGDPITSLDRIDFYSAGDLVGSHPDPVIGAMESISIQVDSADYYSVTAIPVSNSVLGYQRETETKWVGLDYPAAVENLTLTLNGDESVLSWTPPVAGGNGGYYDGQVIEYQITRCDGKFITVPGNINSFSEQLDMMGTINYTVEARNDSDIGDPSTTNEVYYVSDDYMYYDDFWIDVVQSGSDPIAMGPYQWQSNTTTTLADWSYFTSNFTNTDPGEISYLWSSNSVPNQTVRLISPVFDKQGAENITIQMNSYLEASNSAFSFFIETSSDGGATWTEVHEWLVDGVLIDEVTSKVVANSDVGSDNFQMAITYKGNTTTPGFIRFDNIRVFNQPSTDILVSKFEQLATVNPADDIVLRADIENNSTTMLSCAVKCTVRERFGTNILYENEVAADDLGIGEIRNIDFGTWPGEEGEYLVDIEVLFAGGDDNPDNDIITRELNVLFLGQRERVLMEDFTGTWCSYCPGAALGIKELMDNGYPIAVIGRHRNDDYETMDMEDRIAQYTVEGYPTMMIDGVVKLIGGDPTVSVAGLYIDDINARSGTNTPVQVDIVQAKIEGNTYTATATATSASIINNPNYELRFSVIESGIDDEWLGIPTVDEAQRYYADRPLNLSDGYDLKTVSFDLNDILDNENAELVVYVQDVSTNEVMNATLIDLNVEVTDVDDFINDHSIALAPNPASDKITIDLSGDYICQISIINELGQLLHFQKVDNQSKHTVDIADLKSGVYIIQIKTSTAEKLTKKFSVIR